MLRLPNELWHIIASYSCSTELKTLNILCSYIYVAIRDIVKQNYNPLLPLLYIYPDAPWHNPALLTNLCLPISYVKEQDYRTDAIYNRKDAIELSSAPPSTFYKYASHEYLQEHYPDATKCQIQSNKNISIDEFNTYGAIIDEGYDTFITQMHNILVNPYEVNIEMIKTLRTVPFGSEFQSTANAGILVEDFITHPHLFAPEHIAANRNITLADIYHIDNLRIYDKKIINYVFMCPNLTYDELIKLLNDPDIINDFYTLSHNNFNR